MPKAFDVKVPVALHDPNRSDLNFSLDRNYGLEQMMLDYWEGLFNEIGLWIEDKTGIDVMNGFNSFLSSVLAAITRDQAAQAANLQDFITKLQGWSDKVPLAGELAEVLSGVEDGDLNDIGTWVNSLDENFAAGAQQIQEVIDNIFRAIFGGASTGNPLASIQTSLEQAWASLWDGLTGGNGTTKKLPSDVKTVAAALNSTAGTANTNANTGLANIQTTIDNIWQAIFGGTSTGNPLAGVKTSLEQAWASLWDGLNGTSGTTSKLPGDVKTVAAAVKSTAGTANTNANTGLANIQTTIDNITQAILGGTSTNNPLAAVKTNLQQAWASLWDGLNGTSGATSKLPTDVKTVAAAVKSTAGTALTNAATADGKAVTATTNLQTTIDNIWQAIFGGTSTGNPLAGVKTSLEQAWASLWDGLNGTSGATSKLPGDVKTVAAAVKSTAGTALTNAATADGKAVTADGKAVTATTNLQTTIDNIWQAIFGGTSTGNPLAGVKTSLEQAWASLWDGLNGTSGATSKLPGDVKTVAAAVKSTAGTALTNAATADGKAVTADGKAVSAQGTANTATTNLQATVDNIWQSIFGGSTTNNTFASVKTSLEQTWAHFWDGLNGTTGATSKLPTDVKTVAAAVKSTAGTALTNAATADAKAVAAQTKADQAAAALNNAQATGANVIYDGGFENAYLWNPLPGVVNGGVWSTEQAHTGSRSLKFAMAGATKAVTLTSLPDRTSVTTWPTDNTRKYYVEAWIFPHANNSHAAGFVSLNTPVLKPNGTYSYPIASFNTSTLTKGVWQKLSTTVIMPSDAVGWYVYLRMDTTITSGDIFYWDDARAVDVTEAYDAKVVADAAAANLQATVDNIHQAVQGGSSTNNTFASVKTNLSQAWAHFWDGLNGTTGATSKLPTDVRTVATAVKSTAGTALTNAATADGKAVTATTNLQTTVDNIWQSIFGGTQTNNTFASVKTSLEQTWAHFWDGLNGTTGATSKLPTDVKTVAAAVKSTAGTALTNAATADGKAVTADGKAVTADGKAVAAQGTANTATTNLQATIDNIWQSILGGSSTGNTVASVKTNLSQAWAHFWDGLNGTTGATSKLPTDVKTVAAAVKSTAGTALTNAATADGKAVTADGKAVTADGKATTATTNLQTTVDNIWQSIFGGTQTNNTFASVKTSLEQTWAHFWDGLNGTTGATSKLPTDVKTVAAAVKSTAGTALTNAATADGKAVTADGKAVRAAGGIASLSVSGANMVFDPGFENQDVWGASAHSTINGTNGSTSSTEQARSGTYSRKIVANGTANQNVYWNADLRNLNVQDHAAMYPTAQGRVYYMEAWVFPKATNVGTTGTLTMGMGAKNYAAGTWVWPNAVTVNNSALTKGVWNKVSGYATISAASNGLYPFLYSALTVNTGDTFYIDDVLLIDATDAVAAQATANTGVTNAATADGKAVAAQGTANTATTNLQGTIDNIWQSILGGSSTGNTVASVKTNLSQAWAHFWDGLNGTTGATSKLPTDVKTVAAAVKSTAGTALTNAATADGKAVTADGKAVVAQSLSRGLIAGGSNMVSNPGFENTTFWVGATGVGGGYSTEQKLTGTYSMKVVHDGANYTTPYLITDTTTTVSVPVSPGDVIYCEAWVYGKSTNVATTQSLWFQANIESSTAGSFTYPTCGWTVAGTALNGTWTKISGNLTMPANAAAMRDLYLVGGNLIPAGNTYYWDGVIVREITTGTTALTNASAAQSTANTGVTNAATADGKAVAAQGTANTATTNLQGTIDNIWQSILGGSSTGNTVASVKTNLSQAWAHFWDGLNGTTGATSKLPTDVKTVAAAVKSTAGTALTNAATADGKAVTADGKAVTADSKAVVAQSLAGTTITSGSNLVANGDFENTNFYGNANFSTEQKRYGTRSLKLTGNGASVVDYYVTNDHDSQYVKVPAAAGDWYYVEFYVWGNTANVGTPGSIDFYLGYYNTADANLGYGSILTTAATVGTGAWVKVSGTFQAPANTVWVNARVRVNAAVPATNSFYFDSVLIREITTAKTALTDAASAQSTANTGVTNAATADGKAVTADGKAVAAQGTANTATTNLQATVDNIWQSILGGSSTGNTFASVKTNLSQAWAHFWDGLNGTTGATSKLPTDVKTVAAAVKSTAGTALTNAATADGKAVTVTNNHGSLVDNVAAAFTGVTSTGRTLSDSLAAMQLAHSTMSTHTRQIQELQTKKQASSARGVSIHYDFGAYANGNLPAEFTVTYSGHASGTSTIGITNGQALWRTTNNYDRDAKIIHSTPTNTDFQILRGTMDVPPEWNLSGGTPKFSAIGRVSADGNSFIWARGYCDGFLSYKGEMGCTVNGVETVWASNVSLGWNLDMTLVCGVGTNARQYQVWAGNTLVKEHTEVGTTSMLGSGYRKWGCIAQVRTNSSGTPAHSGKLGGASITDNEAPTVTGSVARMNRTSTGTASFAGASAITAVPNSFFGAIDYESLDVDANTSDGTFTVRDAKPYIVSGRIKISSALYAWANLAVQVYRNSAWVTLDHGASLYPDGTLVAISGTWVVYLNAGEKVRLAARHSGSTVSVLTGEASGAETYFSIAGVGE